MDETKDKALMFDEFVNEWSLERIKDLKIEEYTNLNKDSFTYGIETQMRSLGSINGISSFIFGIYKRYDTSYKESKNQYIYTKEYAWYKRYGNNANDVFEKVKKNLIKVIENAQKSNLLAIEEIDLPRIYKWKVAFHYQNKNNICITPVFTEGALKSYALNKGIYKNGMSMAELYLAIKNNEQYKNLESAITVAEKIWDDFKNMNLAHERDIIENSDLSESERTNATSSLDYIEYEIKAHKIIRRNPHNHLESSFYQFLSNIINAKKIQQNISYIDFCFELNDKKYICELKPSENQREISYALQGAIGQILRYSLNRNFDYKIIVFQGKPKDENLQFLEYLKEYHNIYYLYEEKIGIFKGNILS